MVEPTYGPLKGVTSTPILGIQSEYLSVYLNWLLLNLCKYQSLYDIQVDIDFDQKKWKLAKEWRKGRNLKFRD